jgi:hypothetical protein
MTGKSVDGVNKSAAVKKAVNLYPSRNSIVASVQSMFGTPTI